MKKTLFLFLPAICLFACKTLSDVNEKPNDRFERFKGSFIENMWKVYPGWANSQGYHNYDSVLVIPDDKQRSREADFTKTYLDSLHLFKIDSLTPANKIDYHLIENQLQSALWALNEFKEYEWNPANYNVADAFALLLSERYAPLDQRLHSFNNKLNHVQAYYEAARKTIHNPTIEHTDLAIQQNKGALDIFGLMLEDSLKASGLSANEKIEIHKKAQKAMEAVNAFVHWLEQEVRPGLKPETARSFHIGKMLYEQKFNYDLQSAYTAEQIYQKALKRKDEIHNEMAKLATQLWQKYFSKQPVPADRFELIRKVIDTLSSHHAKPDSFLQAVQKQLPHLINFINEKKLLYIDPSKPLVVRQTPEYMEGFSVASINAPGPYDKNANTYYNVGSLKKYTPQGAESFLREYNDYTLQIINIHEAIPGHYTQLVYSNQSPSLIKSIFGSSAMVEGWAVYTERMMLEEGYGNNDPALWLLYYKWHLRSVCNTILDYGLQVNNMSKEDAMKLMMHDGFQTEAEATGKYRRASLSQVQLCSYFTGFTEIYDLREEMKKKLGDKFDLKAFHEKFLSYGSAPVKYIRALMLEEK